MKARLVIPIFALLLFQFVTFAQKDKLQGTLLDTPIFASRAHVEIYGNQKKPPLVLVHGLGENGCKDWYSLINELSEDFYIVTFDLPGFGRSEKQNEFYSPEKYSRFIDYIRAKYIRGRFTLIGHSMGAAISLDYAANYSKHVKRLILVDAAGILHRNAFSRHFIDDFRPNSWLSMVPSLSKVEDTLGFTMEDISIPPWMLDYAVETPLIREKFFRGNPTLIAAFALIMHNYTGMPESVQCPTLIIWGADDTIAPVRTAHLLHKRINRSRLEIIPGSGHVPMAEVEGKFNELVLNELFTKVEAIRDSTPKRRTRSKGTVVITANSAKHFSGRCDELVIKGAEHVLIEDSEIGTLTVANSNVSLVNCTIGKGGNEQAIMAIQSRLMATAVDVYSENALYASESNLDFAGVHFIGEQVSFEGNPGSQGVFSICYRDVLSNPQKLHGVLKIEDL